MVRSELRKIKDSKPALSNMEKQEKYDSWAQNKRFDAFSDQVVYLCW